MKRRDIEKQASSIFNEYHNILLELATGFGKTSLALKLLDGRKKNLIVVPYDSIKDSWKNEDKKWFNGKKLGKSDIITYQSLHKVKDIYDAVVLDECHHITSNNLGYVKDLNSNIIALSATVDTDKKVLLFELGINKINTIRVTTDSAIDNEVLPDYRMVVWKLNMDYQNKNIPIKYSKNGKKQTFYTTEGDNYSYINDNFSKIQQLFYANDLDPFKMAFNKAYVKKVNTGNSDKDKFLKSRGFLFSNYMRKRKDLIYQSPTKKTYINKIINEMRRLNKRFICFVGTINMCNELSSSTYHSKMTDDAKIKALDDFNNGVTNELFAVNALDEGVNLKDVEVGIIGQINSKERRLVQRLGRLLRGDSEQMNTLYITVLKDTQDEKWFHSATQDIDKNKIQYEEYEG